MCSHREINSTNCNVSSELAVNPPPPAPTSYVTRVPNPQPLYTHTHTPDTQPSYCTFLPAFSLGPSLWPKAFGPGSCLQYQFTVGAHVHNITYVPLIDTALYIMFLMRTNPLLGKVGRGWALEISTFWGPNVTWFAGCHFRVQKVLISSALPPPTCPHNRSARVWGRINHRSINSYNLAEAGVFAASFFFTNARILRLRWRFLFLLFFRIIR